LFDLTCCPNLISANSVPAAVAVIVKFICFLLFGRRLFPGFYQ
jgi:hypothetical protein